MESMALQRVESGWVPCSRDRRRKAGTEGVIGTSWGQRASHCMQVRQVHTASPLPLASLATRPSARWRISRRGESTWFILTREIPPNARGPLMVDSMLRVGYAIFAIGTLGFLGLGLPPPDPDWGSMVNEARKNIFTAPWAVIWPAAAIASLVIGLNLMADGLREELTRYQN